MFIYSLTLPTNCFIKHHFLKLCIDVISEEMFKTNPDLSNIEIRKDVFENFNLTLTHIISAVFQI